MLKRPPSTSSIIKTLPKKTLTFPNKAKLSNLLRTPLKPNSPIKNSPQHHQSNPDLKPQKSNSISYSNNNGSSILIFGSTPSIIQINNFIPNQNQKNKTKILNIPQKRSFNQEHKRTYTSEYDLIQEKDMINMPFTARNDPNNKLLGILDHKASLPLLGCENFGKKEGKTLEKFGINLKALMSMKNNPKFQRFNNPIKNVNGMKIQSPVKIKNLSSRAEEKNHEIYEKQEKSEKREKSEKFEKNEKYETNEKYEKYEKAKEDHNKNKDKVVDFKDMMGTLLQKAKRLLQIYNLKEKKWKIEREALKREIFLLKKEDQNMK